VGSARPVALLMSFPRGGLEAALAGALLAAVFLGLAVGLRLSVLRHVSVCTYGGARWWVMRVVIVAPFYRPGVGGVELSTVLRVGSWSAGLRFIAFTVFNNRGKVICGGQVFVYRPGSWLRLWHASVRGLRPSVVHILVFSCTCFKRLGGGGPVETLD